MNLILRLAAIARQNIPSAAAAVSYILPLRAEEETNMDEVQQFERCERCKKKIDPETPIQIGDPLICDICSDSEDGGLTE